MMKKVLTPSTIIVFFWGIGLLIINEKFYDYLRLYLCLSILIAIGWIILDQVKKRKEDRR
ncbi:hypothetical protein [Flavobacterium anhuiense]|uniref:hypothetical protein n=1 Tax=Flavobacterium anhuiense TaxID=459526 RepID=UPI0011837421|nr:hypothetical protein [Flavobacterium anhuiense]